MVTETVVTGKVYKDVHAEILEFIKDAESQIKKDNGKIISISHSIAESRESGAWNSGSVIIYWEKEINPNEDLGPGE